MSNGDRVFQCDSCGEVWSYSTQDWKSPEGEHCPECGKNTQSVPFDITCQQDD